MSLKIQTTGQFEVSCFKISTGPLRKHCFRWTRTQLSNAKMLWIEPKIQDYEQLRLLVILLLDEHRTLKENYLKVYPSYLQFKIVHVLRAYLLSFPGDLPPKCNPQDIVWTLTFYHCELLTCH